MAVCRKTGRGLEGAVDIFPTTIEVLVEVFPARAKGFGQELLVLIVPSLEVFDTVFEGSPGRNEFSLQLVETQAKAGRHGAVKPVALQALLGEPQFHTHPVQLAREAHNMGRWHF